MSRDWYKPLIWLLWLALPTTVLSCWRAWDRLPMRMAVHFDAYWQPNGYTSRQAALELGLGIMIFMLTISTVVALIAHTLTAGPAPRVLLAVFYVTVGVCWYANYSIIKFNLHASPAHSELGGLRVPGDE